MPAVRMRAVAYRCPKQVRVLPDRVVILVAEGCWRGGVHERWVVHRHHHL